MNETSPFICIAALVLKIVCACYILNTIIVNALSFLVSFWNWIEGRQNDQLGLNIYCWKDIYLYINFILNDFD